MKGPRVEERILTSLTYVPPKLAKREDRNTAGVEVTEEEDDDCERASERAKRVNKKASERSGVHSNKEERRHSIFFF